MRSILAVAALAWATSAAFAQTMPNANQTPEQSHSGAIVMPNANKTPEGSNSLPNASGTVSGGTGTSNATTDGALSPAPLPQQCIPAQSQTCPPSPLCPNQPLPQTTGTPACPLPATPR